MSNEPSESINLATPSDLWREHRGDGYDGRSRGDDGVSPRPLHPTASIAVVGARSTTEATRADHRSSEATLDHLARVALVTKALTSALDANEVVDIVVRQGMAGLGAVSGILAFVDADGVLVPAVAVGYPPEAIASFAPMTLDQELPLTVAARGAEAVWVSSREEARARFPELVARSRTTTEAWAAIPLVAADSVLGVLGIGFSAPREFSSCERLFIGALADVSALALGRSRAPMQGEPDDAESGRRRKLVFAATLTLARVMTDASIEPTVADRLIEVIDDLDAAIRVRPAPDVAPPVRLCRFDDGEEFAYRRGHDFFRMSDHRVWAHQSGDLLLSARSGAPFARAVGKAFHDIDTGVPLYYVRSR